LRRGASLPRPT